MPAVRQDVVQMSFDIDMGELNKLTGTLEDTKKVLSSGFGDDAFDEMVKESKKAKEGVEGIKKGLYGIDSDGVDDVAKGLKNTDKEGKNAFKQLQKIGKTTFDKTVAGLKKIGTTLKNVGIQAGKFLLKGLAIGIAGVGALVTKSVMNYADYEQLVGGVETLFGAGGQSLADYAKATGRTTKGAQKDYYALMRAQTTVMKNAKNAYRTAGLSANDYMSTVTSFSASLIQSLGGDTEKAAAYADMAIIDMADNANKMGTDMTSIQDAYQGFAKQNYTMLDNLKLGYGGTQEEMKRLLKDASAISGIEYDISSYADVVQAIHVIQENMGIAGTTSKEASETISGSFASMKAAWGNTLTSLILGGDEFDKCVDNLVDSAKTFGKNIMPAITKALSGVGSLIEELAPIVEKELPGIIDTLLPPLIKAATSLVKGLIIALPSIISTLAAELPNILSELWAGIKEAFGDTPGFQKAEVFFNKLITFLKENTGTIKKVIGAFIGLVAALKLFDKIKGITGLFGGGKGGSNGDGFFSKLTKMKPKTVLKGLANLAIIMVGIGALAAVFMWVAPYMAQLSDLKSIGEVLLVVGLIGLLGTEMAKLAGKVGMIPVATVAKGLANIAIVMVGFGALAAVLMWVAPYMSQLSDFRSLFKILVIIGLVGLLGSALAGLAGLVGAIPIVAVLSGLGNIALALGGFTAIVAAFGALSQIDGLSDFLESGGDVLAQLCGIIGEMAGELIGGALEGIANNLPDIGTKISEFATSIKPAFDTFGSIKADGLGDFAGALGTLMGVLVGDAVLSFFTGGNDYADFGTKLSAFATNASTFFTTVKDIPEEAFGKMTSLFNALAGVNSLPKDGGVVGWFEGEIDFSKIAAGMTALAGASSAFTTIQNIPDAAFTKMTGLFNALAGISSLPKDGGVVGWFEGEVAFDKIASGLQSLAGAAGAFTTIQNIPDSAFGKLTSLFNALAGINGLPKDGGVAGWFEGEVSFDKIAAGLQSLTSESMIAAFTAIQNLPVAAFSNMTALFNALAGIKAMPKEGGIAGWFGGDASTGLSNISSQLPGVATNIASFFTNLGGRTDFTPISSLFNTLSSIKIDSDAASKGFLGLGSSQLESMGSGLSAFATNAATFFDKINGLNIENLTNFFAQLGTVGDLPDQISSIDGTVGTALSNMVTTVETKFTEMKTATTTGMTGIVSAITEKTTSFYNSGVDLMSGLNSGMLSMLPTLVATAASMAASIQSAFDVELKIHSPSRVMIDKGEDWGTGGIIGMRNMIPEAKVAAQDFARATTTPFNTYTPESSADTYNNSTTSEVMNIAPVFELHVSGSQDDRSTARKVKRWVKEAIDETFESLERKTYVTREA